MQIIGKCSICGGRVVKPDFDYSTVPSTAATCMKCGAVGDNLPTIKMRPKGIEGMYRGGAPVAYSATGNPEIRTIGAKCCTSGSQREMLEFGGQRFM